MLATATKSKRCKLAESTAALTASTRVDAPGGIIHGVKVLGFSSSNDRVYTRNCLAEAQTMYEGVRVFSDHDRSGGERKMKDFVGTLRNLRLTDSGLYADLQLVRSHPLAPAIFERAERMPESFGLSHAATGEVSKANGKLIVNRITQIDSVDLVCFPATASGLFESHTAPNLSQLKQNAPNRSRQQLEIVELWLTAKKVLH